MPDVRALLEWRQPYHTINREERNLAALLYHALLLPGNLRRFLASIECPFAFDEDQVALYFEYALLRDLWRARAHGREAAARRVLSEALGVDPALRLDALSIEELNAFFGAGPKPSRKYVQSPSTWSVRRFMRTIEDDDLFLRVCRFKWCFNAKPDLVIQLGRDEVVCVEAKLDSREGSYPSQKVEKAEFARRGLARVGQTELQREMFERFLGMRSQFVFLVAGGVGARSQSHARLTWSDAFAGLDLSESPAFVRTWVERIV